MWIKLEYHPRDWNYKHETNSGDEKYNNWKEVFTRGIWQQIWASRRINELIDRTAEIIESGAERERDEQKWTEPERRVGYQQMNQYTHYGSTKRRWSKKG